MNAIKLLTAATLLTAASSAFAGTDDGNLGPTWLMPTVPAQTTATKQAPVSSPAPSTTGASAGDTGKSVRASQDMFLRQQRAESDGGSNVQ